MALTGEFAAQVLRSAIGVILQQEGEINEFRLAQRIQDNNPGILPHTIQEYQGIARQALRIARSGSDVLFGGFSAIPVRELPIDPSLQPGDARVRYRALVTVTDEYGRETRRMAVLDTDAALAADDIADRIKSDIDRYESQKRISRPKIGVLGPNDTVDVLIITAGRRK